MTPEVEQELAYVLLTELLASQFTSPVRWIETQDVFLKDFFTERVVEIGPSPTLSVIAQRTMESKYESYDAALALQRHVFCYTKDARQISYRPGADDWAAKGNALNAAETTAAAAAAAAAPVADPSGSVADIPDEPAKALFQLHVLVAHKMKKPLNFFQMSKTFKDLGGGKLIVQNEVSGNLGKKFGSTTENPEKTPLEEQAESFQKTFSGFSRQTVVFFFFSRFMSSNIPGGFIITFARKYLQTC